MATVTVLPTGTYPIGSYNLGPASVPNGASRATLALDGASMTDPALHVEMKLDFSLDDGATWASESPGPATNPYPIAMTLDGGAVDKSGNPLPQYFLSAVLPSPQSATRRMRGTVTISGQPLTTTGTLEIV